MGVITTPSRSSITASPYWIERSHCTGPCRMRYIRLGVATAYASQSRRADEPLARRQRRLRKLNYWRKPSSSLVLSLSALTAPSADRKPPCWFTLSRSSRSG